MPKSAPKPDPRSSATRSAGPERQKSRRGSGAVRIYERLRQEILCLELKPGSALDEVSLGNRFKLSRSPVREALVRLASEGLVVILRNRSTIVAPFDLQAMPSFLDALALMQRATHRLAAMFRSDGDLKRITQAQTDFELAHRRGDILAMIESNYAFHMAIAEAGGNSYLTAVYGRLLDEAKRMHHLHYSRAAGESSLATAPSLPEHAGLTKAIQRRDADLAERLAQEHIFQFRNSLTRFLDQHETAPVDLAELGASPAQAATWPAGRPRMVRATR
jgi:DNA-binding GntR family transcriptional regulator